MPPPSRLCTTSNIVNCGTLSFVFFNDTATTKIYTLSYTTLFRSESAAPGATEQTCARLRSDPFLRPLQRRGIHRSEEHTSELQSRFDLVCRLLLEKKKIRNFSHGCLQ